MRFYAILLSFCLLLACNKNTEQAMINTSAAKNGDALTYLALGDSYTIGESVAQKESFPYQLVSKLKAQKINVAVNPKIIAKTGWTTDELQTAIKTENITQNYDIVTLLIGVNNQYRGYSVTTYRTEFKALLQTAINFAGKNKKHVFVVSIPDWGVTPFGKGSGRNIQAISSEIDAFNAINKEETLAAGLSYTDITTASRNAATDASLIATDGLHPSDKMYAEWAAKVAHAVAEAFR
ncbi:SGNH/GDSL hydrolase family protein [Pedobacter polaris]|uniref:SGNH/GDSL hydrolase family protein n=1 Tax=Pedobacter polaris TaxID=2571273 RepID=A0A4U1CXU5_9SPHI|nr:SGNH/GDSL hydrolase family protein [Pedobacter polaris]TKC12319.1 SGNH/GDSL hydrolase family protein [Pedobacter polaris]